LLTINYNFFHLQKLEHASSEFLAFGFPRDAISVFQDHANILNRLAKASSERAVKHEYYVRVCFCIICIFSACYYQWFQGLEQMGKAATTADKILLAVNSTNPIHEVWKL
jgi:hypothetical protein